MSQDISLTQIAWGSFWQVYIHSSGFICVNILLCICSVPISFYCCVSVMFMCMCCYCACVFWFLLWLFNSARIDDFVSCHVSLSLFKCSVLLLFYCSVPTNMSICFRLALMSDTIYTCPVLACFPNTLSRGPIALRSCFCMFYCKLFLCIVFRVYTFILFSKTPCLFLLLHLARLCTAVSVCNNLI